jgi:hypothetical protein
MGLFSRARYYAGRVRDAGLVGSAQKIRSLLSPYLWAPAYLSGFASGRVPGDGLKRLDQLGADLRGGLTQQAASRPDYVRRAQARAQSALSGPWTVLGYGQTAMPVGAAWAEDAFHFYRWPNRYFAFVDFVAAGSRCDVKVPWELSRLQPLVWLAEGYLFAPEAREQCVARFSAIVEDWVTSNRPGFGPNWTCAMEVAIRGLNLMLSAAVFGDGLAAAMRQRVAQSLADHYVFLRRFPELSDIPGNHYLTDLLGEVGLSIVVGLPGEFDHAVEAFADEADKQFEPDGCHLERAIVYHRLCTDMVALAAVFATRQSGAAPDRILKILERAVQFAVLMADRSGRLPVLGDCDSGQILDFGLPARDISALLAHDERADPQQIPDPAIWLRAVSGIDRAVHVDVGPPQQAGCRSGFLAARAAACTVTMRVGTQGLGGRASHDHDDAQSIWLSLDGQDLIVDQGCHSYTLDPAIRNGNISSRVHNVLQPVAMPRFGGRTGSINLTMRGAPTCSAAAATSSGEDVRLTATIDRAGAMSEITRLVDLRRVPDGYELDVTDTWSAGDPLELRWHFGPGFRPEIADLTRVEFDRSGPIDSVRFEGQGLLKLEVFAFDFSPVYGQRLPCFGVRAVLAPAPHGSLISRFKIGVADQPTHQDVAG